MHNCPNVHNRPRILVRGSFFGDYNKCTDLKNVHEQSCSSSTFQHICMDVLVCIANYVEPLGFNSWFLAFQPTPRIFSLSKTSLLTHHWVIEHEFLQIRTKIPKKNSPKKMIMSKKDPNMIKFLNK